MSFQTTRKGLFRVLEDGKHETSSHRELLEALSAASDLGVGTHLVMQPPIEVEVQLDVSPVPAPVPAPIPVPSPVPASPSPVPVPPPAPTVPPPSGIAARDVLAGEEPFSPDSPWWSAMGDAAQLVPAGLTVDKYTAVNMPCPTADPIFIFRPGPNSTRREIVKALDWGRGRDTAVQPKQVLGYGMVPRRFVRKGANDNDGFASWNEDEWRYEQGQPAAVPEEGGPLLCGAPYHPVDPWGDGNRQPNGSPAKGPHGASKAPAFAGLLMVGDFDEGSPGPQRPVMVMVDMARGYRPSSLADAFVAPALGADSYWASGWNADRGVSGYGTDPDARGKYRMGNRLALPRNFDLSQMRTVPGRMLAWSAIHWGHWIVDDARQQFGYCTEAGDRDFEVYFRARFGFDFEARRRASSPVAQAWSDDIARIVTSLCIVIDARRGRWGGGGITMAAPRPLKPRPPAKTLP